MRSCRVPKIEFGHVRQLGRRLILTIEWPRVKPVHEDEDGERLQRRPPAGWAYYLLQLTVINGGLE